MLLIALSEHQVIIKFETILTISGIKNMASLGLCMQFKTFFMSMILGGCDISIIATVNMTMVDGCGRNKNSHHFYLLL